LRRKNIEAITIKNPNWRETAENHLKLIRRELKKDAIKILQNENTERAFKYIIDANKEAVEFDICNALWWCARARRIKPISKVKAKIIADSLIFAYQDFIHIFDDFEYSEIPIKLAIEYYYAVAQHQKHGKPSSRATYLAIMLHNDFKKIYGRPIYEAISSLLRATFPEHEWDASTVKTICFRRHK
jgi:hypothetical protein